jgi:hypothetical protein
MRVPAQARDRNNGLEALERPPGSRVRLLCSSICNAAFVTPDSRRPHPARQGGRGIANRAHLPPAAAGHEARQKDRPRRLGGYISDR